MRGQICSKCPHLRNQHSVYRDLCLVKDCDCTECSGARYSGAGVRIG